MRLNITIVMSCDSLIVVLVTSLNITRITWICRISCNSFLLIQEVSVIPSDFEYISMQRNIHSNFHCPEFQKMIIKKNIIVNPLSLCVAFAVNKLSNKINNND